MIKISANNLNAINSNEALTNLKGILAQTLNKIGTKASHELIEPALAIIGYENITGAEENKKELIALARKVINYQIEHLDDRGLEWFNAKFSTLSNLSRESKIVFKKIYHKIVEDLTISQLDKELIIKFISQGLTTSLTRQDEIIFEGKKYKLQGVNVKAMLEEIAKAVITQDNDILAGQYKDHRPIFPKSLDIGIKTASSDIDEMLSIVNKNYVLQTNEWLLTNLIEETSNKEILLLEQRSSTGDHLLYVVKDGTTELLQLGSNDVANSNNKVEWSIFGAYKPNTVYKGEAKVLRDLEGQSIAAMLDVSDNKQVVKFSAANSEDHSKQHYFQQELLGLGHEDRFNYIDQELKQKVSSNAAVLEAKLNPLKLKPEVQQAIEEYYKAFILTFSSVYAAAQAVDSGQLSIDASDQTTGILSTLASFAPFGIGDVLSKGITGVGEFLQGNKMKNEAKLVKKLAMDAVELSEIAGKSGLGIVLDQEQQQRIYQAKDGDPEGLVSKLSSFYKELIVSAEKYSKLNLSEHELHKSPAAKLGETDANNLIKQWLVQNKLESSIPHRLKVGMSNDALINQFVCIVSGKEIIEASSPTKSLVVEVKKSTACCEIFFTKEATYDNLLLNDGDLLRKFISSYGTTVTNGLIDLSAALGNDTIREILEGGHAFEEFSILMGVNTWEQHSSI